MTMLLKSIRWITTFVLALMFSVNVLGSAVALDDADYRQLVVRLVVASVLGVLVWWVYPSKPDSSS